jgi:transcriptional regulator with XRE-family HTH domain
VGSVNIAEIFKRLRKSAGLSQIEMANILGRDQATISRLEKGTQSLSLESVFTLSDFFELNYEDILSGHINYWKVSEKFNITLKIDPKYLKNKKSVVRELIPLMNLLVRKKGAEALRNFLAEFQMEDLIHMSPSEAIGSSIYFDLMSKAIADGLLAEEDIPVLVKMTQSTEYHGSFYHVYEKQKGPIDIIKAYCHNSPEYEGAIENNILSSSERSVTVGFKLRDFLKDEDILSLELASFITKFKRSFFENLPQTFGYKEFLAQKPTNSNKKLSEEVSIKLIQRA